MKKGKSERLVKRGDSAWSVEPIVAHLELRFVSTHTYGLKVFSQMKDGIETTAIYF